MVAIMVVNTIAKMITNAGLNTTAKKTPRNASIHFHTFFIRIVGNTMIEY